MQTPTPCRWGVASLRISSPTRQPTRRSSTAEKADSDPFRVRCRHEEWQSPDSISALKLACGVQLIYRTFAAPLVSLLGWRFAAQSNNNNARDVGNKATWPEFLRHAKYAHAALVTASLRVSINLLHFKL